MSVQMKYKKIFTKSGTQKTLQKIVKPYQLTLELRNTKKKESINKNYLEEKEKYSELRLHT
jgi:hypothetical protein